MKVTKKRMIAKAVTWKLIGLVVVTSLTYMMTGNFTTASVLAGKFMAISFVLYFIHEWVWEHILWGKQRK